MLVLAIWLFLLGYVIAWTGKMNLGVSYKPQKDGSIQAVDDKGNAAKTYSLMDAITCAQPSGSPSGIAGTPSSSDQRKRAEQMARDVTNKPGLIEARDFNPFSLPTVTIPRIQRSLGVTPGESITEKFFKDVKRGFCSWSGWC